MNEEEKDFYSKLGKLAAGFSTLEFWLGNALCQLINKDQFVAKTVIEDVTFSKRIQMLKLLGRFHRGIKKETNELSKELDKIRVTRNLFIHGQWAGPVKTETGYSIIVDDRKIKYSEVDDRCEWKMGEMNVLKKEEIDELETVVTAIISSLEKLTNRLSEMELHD